MIYIILLHALFGTVRPMVKVLLTMTTPIFFTGIRMSVAGLILLINQYFNPKALFTFKKKHLWLYAQLIVIGGYFKWVFKYWGLAYMPVAKMSFLLNISPFITALLSYLAFNEKLTKNKWIGLLFGFIGWLPIIIMSSPEEHSFTEFFFISLPELAIIGSIIANSYSLILMKILIKDKGYSPAMVNGISTLGAGILGLSTALFWGDCILVYDPTKFIPLFAAVIIIGSLICHTLYAYLTKFYSVTFISFTDFLNPLFVTFYSWLFLNEVITWQYYFSAVVVFIGLYLFYKDELKTNRTKSV